MFLRAGYYGRTVIPPPVDGVPDGGAAITSPTWFMSGLTRAEGGAELNPPLVTMTETVGAGVHYAYIDGAFNSGPIIRTRAYLRAGTRRYISVVPGLNALYVVFVIDTQTWTITQQTAVGAGVTITSASLTDLSNGDYLFDATTVHSNVNSSNVSMFQGAATATGIDWGTSYTGNGSTILVRRFDSDTLPLTLGAGTVTAAATTGTTLTGTTTHTPAGNACVIRYICRNTVTQTYAAPTATFGGQPVVFPTGSRAMINGTINRAFVGIGYVMGLTPGVAGSLAVTSDRALGQLVARVDDVAGLTAAKIGAAFADSYGGTTKTSHPIAATMTAPGSRVLAVVGAVNGSADPFSLSGTWTEQAEGQSGTAATDLAAVFGTKTGGAAATVETMTATGSATTVAWGGAILELKV